MLDQTETGDWFWDIDRQVAVRSDNSGRHDVLIGPYASRRDAEVWMPSSTWTERPSAPPDDDWVDVNSAYD
jgi:hypothetical protein